MLPFSKLQIPTESNATLFLPGFDIQKILQQPFKIHKAHISDLIQSMVIYIPDLQFIDAQDITLNAKYSCFTNKGNNEYL